MKADHVSYHALLRQFHALEQFRPDIRMAVVQFQFVFVQGVCFTRIDEGTLILPKSCTRQPDSIPLCNASDKPSSRATRLASLATRTPCSLDRIFNTGGACRQSNKVSPRAWRSLRLFPGVPSPSIEGICRPPPSWRRRISHLREAVCPSSASSIFMAFARSLSPIAFSQPLAPSKSPWSR